MKTKQNRPDLVAESDRGCTLVAAAMLEESLENMFRKIFASKQSPKELQDSLFDSNGPLATFSAKAKLAFSLGLIDSNAFADLEVIRKLRNGAAHQSHVFDFLNDSVGARIESLYCVQQYKGAIKRYQSSPGLRTRDISQKIQSEPDTSVGPLPRNSEAQMTVAGFLKYRKAIFALGVGDLVFYLDTGIWLDIKSKRNNPDRAT